MLKATYIVIILNLWISVLNSQIQIGSDEDIDTPYQISVDDDEEDTVRIAGGHKSKPHKFPYMVRLYMKEINGTRGPMLCGGSLISRRFVLTAAHCLQNVESVQVRLGAHNPSLEESTQVRVNTTTFLQHPKYKPGVLANDLGIIDLNRSVRLNRYIKVIRIDDGTLNFENQIGLTAGWGRISVDGPHSIELLFITNPILNNTYCKKLHGKVITKNHVCLDSAGYKGICKSDSGGPLVAVKEDIQIGVSSFFDRVCGKSLSSMFTRVGSYFKWIKNNTDIKY